MRRSTRPRSPSSPRALIPRVDRLEGRALLSAAKPPDHVLANPHPMFRVGALVQNTSPPPGAYTPAQIQQAYGFNQISFGAVRGDGTGQTIAIVDAYDDPNIVADLQVFDARFGLPDPTLTRVNQGGGTSLPAADPTGGWELEEALDVEWAHALAPGAAVLLVEASSNSDSDLLPAVDYAAAHANVVSISWGGSEFAGETFSTYENHFIRPGVAFAVSSGDNGAPADWPAVSPNVVAVGGTSLRLDAGNNWSTESAWSGSGGGPSAYEAQPPYQAGVVTQTTRRANPDVAYDANPNTGFAVYDSFNYFGTSYGWIMVGGTSAGAPQWAALLAIADQGRALNHAAALNASSPTEALSLLYQAAGAGAFHDINSGTSTGSPHYTAGTGYDLATGLGTPRANLVVQALVGPDGAAPSGVAFDSGGGAAGNFAADADFTGGTTFSTTDAISTAGVANAAPQAVYQSERYGNFTYTVPNLAPRASYTVRLHFAEIYWNATGQRLFNVAINGASVLSNFDVFAAAGGKDKAVVESFTATADSQGRIAIAYTTVRDNAKSSGIEVILASSAPAGVAFDSGGGDAGTFAADADVTGGSTYSTGDAIDTAGVTNAAPQAVYQTERYGNFTYTVPGLTPGAAYTVRLHFAEIYWNAAGQRLFNIAINGASVLSNFDVFAAAGGKDKAVVESFTATADSQGRITIAYTTVRDNAKSSGIEVVPS